jgi:hypothetical protein
MQPTAMMLCWFIQVLVCFGLCHHMHVQETQSVEKAREASMRPLLDDTDDRRIDVQPDRALQWEIWGDDDSDWSNIPD